MSASQFHVDIRKQNQKYVLDLHGTIDAFANDRLSDAYSQTVEDQTRPIVLNFSEVEFINSTGIAVIVSILAQARQSGRRLDVFGLSEHYLEIFKITKLADFMTIYEDETAALAG